jgi:hypothetical protein
MIDPETRAAMMDAAYARIFDLDDENEDAHRIIVRDALTSAILTAEARGFKLTHREATEDMKHAGACSLDYPSVYMGGPSPGNKIRARYVHKTMHNAAPGWGE